MTKNNLMVLFNSFISFATSLLAFVIAILTIWMPNSKAGSIINEIIEFLNGFKGKDIDNKKE